MSTGTAKPPVVTINDAADLRTYAERQELLRTVTEARRRAREALREAKQREADAKNDCDAAKLAVRDAEASYSNVRTAQVESVAYELLNGPCFLFLCSTAVDDVPDVWRLCTRVAGWFHTRRLEWADTVTEELAALTVGTVRPVVRTPFHARLSKAFRDAGANQRAFPRTFSFQTDLLRLATANWAHHRDAEALPLHSVRALRLLLAACAVRKLPLDLLELVVQYFLLGQPRPGGLPWPAMLLGHVARRGEEPLWFADVAALSWHEEVRAGIIAFDEEEPPEASAKRARRK